MEAARPPSREEISDLLRSIERYNPGNLDLFCRYIKQTVRSFAQSAPLLRRCIPQLFVATCTVWAVAVCCTVNVTISVLPGAGVGSVGREGGGASALRGDAASVAAYHHPSLTLAPHTLLRATNPRENTIPAAAAPLRSPPDCP